MSAFTLESGDLLETPRGGVDGAGRAVATLDHVLDRVTEFERRRAMRALLQVPLLTAEGLHAAEFGLVRKHATWLREWLAHHAGWVLQVTGEVVRLRKTPADLNDSTRPALDRNEAAFPRRRYVLLCLALAALERSERQTTLGRLAEAMVGYVQADPALGAAGIEFDLADSDQRRDLVHVLRFLLDWQVLKRIHGDEQHYLRDQTSDVLYTISRPVLAAMLCVKRGPSTVSAGALAERIGAIVEEPVPDTEDAANRQMRIRLTRRLLDDPVLYYADLDSSERAYLTNQRSRILGQIAQATGLESEIRAEGIAMVDVNGDMTDLGLPEEGTDGHLTLLLAEFLANKIRQKPNALVGFTALRQQTAKLIAEHRAHWRKNATEPGADQALMRQTVERLVALRLAVFETDGVRPLPAIARYALWKIVEKPQLETMLF